MFTINPRPIAPLAAGLLAASTALSQPTSDSPLASPPNGPRHAESTRHAITDATVHLSPGQTIEHATVLIEDGRIVRVGTPSDADPIQLDGYRVWDGAGLHVYAGFIDAFVEVDAPPPDADSPGVHWNARVTPQRSALDGDGIDADTAEARRKLGFTAANITPRSGVFRGSSAVVSLAKRNADTSVDRPPVYARRVANVVSLDRRGGGYPSSQMGAIALIRQTLSDAQWQRISRQAGVHIETNSVDALGDAKRPLLFDVRSELEIIRAAAIADEFERPAIIVGSGTAYRRLDAIRAGGYPLIVPLRFTAVPNVASVGAADAVDLKTLMAWEQDPTNLRRLDAAGVTAAITASRLNKGDKFHASLRKAIAHGLDEQRALAMLTTIPAELLGVGDLMGTVQAGKVANLIVADGPMFEKKTKIRDVWIDGRRHEISPPPPIDIVGEWKFDFDTPGHGGTLIIKKKGDSYTVSGIGDDQDAEELTARNVKLVGNRLSYLVDMPEQDATVIATVVFEGDTLRGVLRLPDGTRMPWFGERTATRDPHGSWNAVELGDTPVEPGDTDAPVFVVARSGVTVKAAGAETEATDVSVRRGEVSFTFDGSEMRMGAEVSVAATIEGDTLIATLTYPDARQDTATFRRAQPDETEDKTDPDKYADVPETLGYPFGPYMMLEPPAQDPVLITNATIWTSGPAGIIERGEIYIEGGLIRAVRSLNEPRSFNVAQNARVIDAAGKHVTPGLIDAHSHTGTWSAGTNEGAQAVTAEVRMQDTTDPDPVNWYRQLAGGATVVNTLHGSANPIGGQNVVQKIRWGVASPNDMHLAGAIPGIKFALGENVKRARSRDSTRYPRTRMGVEALIRDRFVAARQYADAWADWRARLGASLDDDAPQHAEGDGTTTIGGRGTAIDFNIGQAVTRPRRDLELEALAEILAGERLVHCHSYRQDEILMLCRVAQDFGFKIGTFQHVLEGYKVAEAIKEHAIGGSCFSDWWAYKIEVQDAIPYNGAIMHDVGVVVSFNSDSDELARRLNTEAAKAVRYGDISRQQALKFVTINPAIQLMIDDRVGSLEVGKDADLVIWSGDPLSTFTRCETVFIDGREYFSLDRDRTHRDRIAAQRNRIIQKILAEDPKKDKKNGDEEDKSEDPGLVADPYADALREYCLDLYLRGLDPMSHLSDGCGVSLLEHLDAFMNNQSLQHSHN